MPEIFRYLHAVGDDEIDALGHANNVAYLDWMQSAALAHSAARAGPASTIARSAAAGSFAPIRSATFSPAFAGDEVVVETWVATMKKVSSLRRYRMVRQADQTLLAEAETDWAFVDYASGRPRADRWRDGPGLPCSCYPNPAVHRRACLRLREPLHESSGDYRASAAGQLLSRYRAGPRSTRCAAAGTRWFTTTSTRSVSTPSCRTPRSPKALRWTRRSASIATKWRPRMATSWCIPTGGDSHRPCSKAGSIACCTGSGLRIRSRWRGGIIARQAGRAYHHLQHAPRRRTSTVRRPAGESLEELHLRLLRGEAFRAAQFRVDHPQHVARARGLALSGPTQSGPALSAGTVGGRQYAVGSYGEGGERTAFCDASVERKLSEFSLDTAQC